jgi:hypothetical protein
MPSFKSEGAGGCGLRGEPTSLTFVSKAALEEGLPLINKIDLAPYVGASLEVMECDAWRLPRKRPFIFCSRTRSCSCQRGRKITIYETKHEELLKQA